MPHLDLVTDRAGRAWALASAAPAVEQALVQEREGKLTVIDVVLSDFNPR